MSSILPLLAGLPATAPLSVEAGLLSQSQTYAAPVGEGLLWAGEIPDPASSAPRFFISRDGRSFHQLSVTEDRYAPAAGASSLHPFLTRTPGFISMGVIRDDGLLHLLVNDPSQADRLQVLTLLERGSHGLLQRGALYVYPDGEPPAVEGALLRWWERLKEGPPPREIPIEELSHVVRRIGHTINNASSVLLANTSLSVSALEALAFFLERLGGSPTARKALAEALKGSEDLGDAFEELRGHLPPGAKAAHHPADVLSATAADLLQQVQEVEGATRRMVRFMSSTQNRFPNEIPLGATDVESLMTECEEGFRADSASAAAAAPVSRPSPARPAVTEPLLLVEDEDDVAEVMMDSLRHQGFANIRRAGSLEEALRAAEGLPGLKVVLSDYNLSKTETGLQLARLLKQRKPDLRILFVTGNEGDLERDMTPEERSEFEWFAKPVETVTLAERLRALFSNLSPR
jgi:CheY-like chemotaxis protein